MATEAGELIVKISADIEDLKKTLQDMSGKMGTLSATTIAQGTLMADAFKRMGAATLDFVKESVMAFAEHEQAVTRLSLAIGSDGAHALEAYANQLQRTTAFSDDAILSLENQLVQYGIYPESVKRATAALLDFSARTGKDLPEAGQMLAKAMAGQSRELKNYGVDVSLTASRSQNLATVTKFLEDNMKGAAAAMKGTTLGAIQTLGNSFDDLKKQIGELVAPALTKATSALANWIQGINDGIKYSKGYSDTLEDQRAKLKFLNDELKELTSEGRNNTKSLQDQVKATAAHVKELAKAAAAKDKNIGATNREIIAIRQLKDEVQRLQQEQQHLIEITALGTQKRILEAQLALAQMTSDEKKITQITQIETQTRMEQSRMSWETNASFSDQLRVKMADDLNGTTAQFVGMVDTMIGSFSQATAKMIVEGGRFSDILKSMWQQLAEQVISQILRMIAEWIVFQSMTGGIGGGFSGFMAEGGMINEPSMIVGMKSGKKHMAGEAGPEMVVPAGGGSNFAFEGNGGAPGKSGGGSGGGGANITINVSGQFIEGSPSKWQRLIQEQIAPQIRRLAMKDPNSLITRKRGSLS